MVITLSHVFEHPEDDVLTNQEKISLNNKYIDIAIGNVQKQKQLK
jgi:hypothetical protein